MSIQGANGSRSAPGGVGPGGSPGGSFGGGAKQGGNGNAGGYGGMSPAQLNAKYPGATKKKSKSFDATLDNLAKVGGTLIGTVGGPIGTALNAGALAAGAAINGELPDVMHPFEGPRPDVPSVGAGFADNNSKEGLIAHPAEHKPVKPDGVKKKKPAPIGFQLLEGAGGSLLGS